MKNQQDNTGALPALLRTADSVDTPETNSLCCAAAGIIAPSSDTAEVLISHEKLRGAALADATLNAQERPLAQPALEEKTLSILDDQLHIGQLASRNRNRLRIVRENSGTPHSIFVRTIRKQARKNYTLFECPPNHQKGFDHFLQWQVHGIDPLQSHQLCFNSGDNFGLKSYIAGLNISKTFEEKAAHGCCAFGHTINKLENHFVTLTASNHRIPRLLVANVKGSSYSCNTSKRLQPCSSISLCIKCIENDKQRPTQSAYREKEPNHPQACDFQTLQNFEPHEYQRPIATSFSRSLTGFEIGVHGGAI